MENNIGISRIAVAPPRDLKDTAPVQKAPPVSNIPESSKQGAVTRREVVKMLTLGLIGGTYARLIGKFFIPTASSILDCAVNNGKQLVKQGESLTPENKAECIQAGIKEVYGINTEFPESFPASKKISWLSRLSQTLEKYPPQLFMNLATINEQKTIAGLDLNIAIPDEQTPYVDPPGAMLVEKGYTIIFKEDLPGGAAGTASREGHIEIKAAAFSMYNFSALFSHEFGHTVHFLFGEPALSSFSDALHPELFLQSSVQEKATSLPKRLLLPGFVTPYSRFNTREDAAETFSYLLDSPKKALAILEDREYSGELKLKLIAAMDMLSGLSGGLMDKQYYYDLAKNKVDNQYWATKQAEPYIFGRINESTILFVTDIDKSPRKRLPTLIELTEIQDETPLPLLTDTYSLGSLEGREIDISTEDHPPAGQIVNLVVDGIPLNFLYPTEGRRNRVTLQTFSETISFEIETKEGKLFIGKKEKRNTGDISEQALKLIDITGKASQGFGLVVLGAEAFSYLEEVLHSHLPPPKKNNIPKTLLDKTATRRDFLRRTAAAMALAGVVHYLSF